MQAHRTARRLASAPLVVVLIGALFAAGGRAEATGVNGRINFVSARSGNQDVWSMTSTGANELQLTSDAALDGDPAPAPDGKFTAFISDRDGNNELYTMKTNGSTETRLTTTAESESAPAVSPDSTKIAFARSNGSDSDIWLMNADGTAPTQVTTEVEADSTPAFSPDGTLLAFERVSNVWLTTLDGSTQTQLTTGGGFNPAFLPDGRIVYRQGSEIHVMDADGSNDTNLTNDPAFDGDPSPSPDGNFIAFTTFRNGHFDIYVMNADGSNQTNITLLSTNNDTSPAWGSVDTSFPSTTITGPGSTTMDTTPTFTFEADEPATFECSLIAQGSPSSFAPCASPYTADPALAAGTYVFEVRATDADSNVEDPPAAETFTVDLTPPTATIDGSALTNDPTPSFTFSFDEAVQAAATECSLVASGSPDAFASCSSPFTSPSALGAGDYVFKVKGTDVAGNVGSVSSFAFTIDLTPPTVTVDGPSLTNDTTPEFTFSFNETLASGTTECSIVPTGVSDSFSSCASPYTAGVLGDGEYTFKARASDVAGNIGTGSHVVTIDATGPVATITGDDVTNDDTPSFGFTFDEVTQDGSTECSLVASGGADSFAACSSPYTHGTSLVDGDYVFKVRATDELGNPGTAATFPFEVDTTGPTATIDGASVTSDPTPSFTFSFDEAVQSALTECSLVAQGSPDSFSSCSSPYTSASLVDGGYVFKVRGTDDAGNVGPTASFDFVLDSGGPLATITGPSLTNDTTPSFSFTFDEATQDGSILCSLQPATSSDSFSSCSSPFTQPTALADGDHVFKVRATDLAGNVATTSHQVQIDTTGSVATITGTTPTADNTPTLTFVFSEPVSSTSCSLQPSGQPDAFSACTSPFTAPLLADGVHVFKVLGVDMAGNQGLEASFTFTVDATGPVASISGPSATNDTTPTFTFSFNEPIQSGTRQCSLAPSGQPDVFASCSTTYTSSSLADGDYVFKVRATDQLGNVGITAHAVSIDRTAPTVAVTDGPATTTNDTTPIFTFTTDDAVTIRCSMTLAAAPNDFQDCTSPFEATALGDGFYHFKVRGTDAAGNVGSTTYAFTVDTTGPTVTISGPALSNDTSPAFSFAFSEAVDGATVACSLIPVGGSHSFSPCSSPFTPPAPLGEGAYELRVRGSDVLGNSGTPSTMTFSIDLTAPTVEITGKKRTRDRTPKFKFTSSEPSTYECAIDSKPFKSCTSPYISKRLKPKRHTLHVRATDLAGNTGPVTDFVFKIKR